MCSSAGWTGDVELDGTVYGNPAQSVLEQHARARVGPELTVLEPPKHGVHEDHVRSSGSRSNHMTDWLGAPLALFTASTG